MNLVIANEEEVEFSEAIVHLGRQCLHTRSKPFYKHFQFNLQETSLENVLEEEGYI